MDNSWLAFLLAESTLFEHVQVQVGLLAHLHLPLKATPRLCSPASSYSIAAIPLGVLLPSVSPLNDYLIHAIYLLSGVYNAARIVRDTLNKNYQSHITWMSADDIASSCWEL